MTFDHGTRAGYVTFDCRCDECIAWAKQSSLFPKTLYHGMSAYSRGKCRCDVCRGAWRTYQKAYRARPEVKRRTNEAMREMRRLARLARRAGLT